MDFVDIFQSYFFLLLLTENIFLDLIFIEDIMLLYIKKKPRKLWQVFI